MFVCLFVQLSTFYQIITQHCVMSHCKGMVLEGFHVKSKIFLIDHAHGHYHILKIAFLNFVLKHRVRARWIGTDQNNVFQYF